MSMIAFTPIFPFLSVLVGMIAGVVAGLLLAVVFVATHYHDFPFSLVKRGAGGIALIGASALISFFIFRLKVGLPDLDPIKSLSHIYFELVRDRSNCFGWGIVIGFLFVTTLFLASLASGPSGGSRKSLGRSAIRRSSLPSWQ